MSTSTPPSDTSTPRHKRVSGVHRRRAKRAKIPGTRIRLRLSSDDMALLTALAEPGEDAGATIRRVFRATAPILAVLARLDGLASAIATLDARLLRIERTGLAPAPMLADTEDGEAEEPAEPDAVTLQKQAIAGFLGDDDEDE